MRPDRRTDSAVHIPVLREVGGDVTIGVVRDKKEMTLKATLQQPAMRTPRAGSRPGVI